MSVKKNLKELEKSINKQFHKKYHIEPNDYNIIKIEQIIYNETSHIVSIFKDRMILDDFFEFLSKFYPKLESPSLLTKCLSYYATNSIFFPNYSALPEFKLIYKNINDKQRILDECEIEKYKNKIEVIKIEDKESKNKIFDNNVYDSIMKGSSFSNFDIKKDNEKLDSINDINNLLIEIGKNDDKDNNEFNLEIKNFNQNKIIENENKIKIKKEKFNLINKSNLCYNKFKNKYKKPFVYNKNNKNNQNEQNYSSIYIKSNIKQKILNNKINLNNKKDYYLSLIKRKNDSLLTLLNKTKKKTIVYKKLSPINKNIKFSFSIQRKEKIIKNESKSLKTLKKQDNDYNNTEPEQKGNLNIEVFSYVNKPNNIVNYTVKNQYYNNNRLTESNTPIKNENQVSFIKRQINTEIYDKPKDTNYFDFIPKENNIYIFNNNNNINNNNFNIKNKKIEPKVQKKFLDNNKNKPAPLSKEKYKIKTEKKIKNFNNIISSIRSKLKKESKNNISQRILHLMKSRKELSKIHQRSPKNDKLNKNIISLKKFIQMNRKRKEQKNCKQNKLILSLEDSNFKNMNYINSNTIYETSFKNLNNAFKILQTKEAKKMTINNNRILFNIMNRFTSPHSSKNKIIPNLVTTYKTPNNRILSEKRDNFRNYLAINNNVFFRTINNSKDSNNKILFPKKDKKINAETIDNQIYINVRMKEQFKKNKLLLSNDKIKKRTIGINQKNNLNLKKKKKSIKSKY